MKARVLRTNKIVEVEYLGKLGKFAKIFRDIQSGIEYTEDDIVFCFDLNPLVCTDCHQSERLLALGLRKETADMYWTKPFGDWIAIVGGGKIDEDNIPAWSLGRLLELIKHSDICNYNDFGCIKLYVDLDDFETCITMISYMVKEGYFNKEYLV